MDVDDKLTDTPRFEFGRNWNDFLESVTEEHIVESEKSLRELVKAERLDGLRFLDIGSGSALFSLGAMRMGAEVVSFDFDRNSVECANKLKARHYPQSAKWTILQGSVLDRRFVESLGSFDVTYSWGVLHHTGCLWQAVVNAQSTVKPGGTLIIAIYNDQGVVSALWTVVKRNYCRGGLRKALITSIFYPAFFLAGLAADVIKLRNPAARYAEHKRRHRGMSLLHDWKDWLGGYPYEVATPERVTAFLENLGFHLVKKLSPAYGFGNYQFVFRRAT